MSAYFYMLSMPLVINKVMINEAQPLHLIKFLKGHEKCPLYLKLNI